MLTNQYPIEMSHCKLISYFATANGKDSVKILNI